MNSGYFKIVVGKTDLETTAFTGHHGFNQFESAPFGLTILPTTFQRVIKNKVSEGEWQFGLVSYDEFIIFPNILERLTAHAKMILNVLTKDGVPLKLRNGPFFTNVTDHWDHVDKLGWLKVANHTADAVPIEEILTPVTQQLSRFWVSRLFRQPISSSSKRFLSFPHVLR